MKKRIIEAIVAATVSVVVFVSCGRAKVTIDQKNEVSASTDDTLVEMDLEAREQVENSQIFVHVCGQVKKPGVYCLNDGARVYEAVEMAGGPTEEAYVEAINLVEPLYDGQKVYVPSIDQAEDGYVTVDDGLVNINTADLEGLCTIPGIGQTRAQAIISYRESYGHFKAIEELMNVSGIKEGTFEKIKDYIKV